MVTLSLSVVAILGACIWLFLSEFSSLFTPGPSDFVASESEADPLEAHRWLKCHPGEARLRLARREDSQRYVDRLYELGAKYIQVTHVHGLEACGLLIFLPRRPAVRRRLFAAAGLAPEGDTGQAYIHLYWDE